MHTVVCHKNSMEKGFNSSSLGVSCEFFNASPPTVIYFSEKLNYLFHRP